MDDLLEFAGRLLMVFVPSFLLCLLSAHCAMEDQVNAEWKSLTSEQQANYAIRDYFASTASDLASSRRLSIATRKALQFAPSATVVILFLYYAAASNR